MLYNKISAPILPKGPKRPSIYILDPSLNVTSGGTHSNTVYTHWFLYVCSTVTSYLKGIYNQIHSSQQALHFYQFCSLQYFGFIVSKV